MKITVTLDIPESSVYAGVVTDALRCIAQEWDDGARCGELVLTSVGYGELPATDKTVTWDSEAREEKSS